MYLKYRLQYRDTHASLKELVCSTGNLDEGRSSETSMLDISCRRTFLLSGSSRVGFRDERPRFQSQRLCSTLLFFYTTFIKKIKCYSFHPISLVYRNVIWTLERRRNPELFKLFERFSPPFPILVESGASDHMCKTRELAGLKRGSAGIRPALNTSANT